MRSVSIFLFLICLLVNRAFAQEEIIYNNEFDTNGSWGINPMCKTEIKNGKLWIQCDGTPYGIANELEQEGIKKSEIVLAFHEPEVRKFTEYAIA